MSVSGIEILAIFCAIPIIAIMGCIICAFVDNIKEKKFKKKYPELFELIDKREKMENEHIKNYNDRIPPLFNKIDYIISQQKYMTKEDIIKSEIELEELRKKIKQGQLDYRNIDYNNTENMTKEIENMIRKDKKLLKFMKGRGWCKDDKR